MRFGNAHPAVDFTPPIEGGLGYGVLPADRLDRPFVAPGTRLRVLLQDSNDLLPRKLSLLHPTPPFL